MSRPHENTRNAARAKFDMMQLQMSKLATALDAWDASGTHEAAREADRLAHGVALDGYELGDILVAYIAATR